MSNSPSHNTSPSNSQIDRATSEAPEAPTTSTSHSAETHQSTAGQRSQSTPPILVLDRRSITSNPRPPGSLVLIQRAPQATSQAVSDSRQGRPLVARHAIRQSTSQSPHRVFNPYARPSPFVRARSQPQTSTMSSASTPSNTSTAGASSGSNSNPSYQLPYAPFPYPMPANGGSGQQGGKGGSGK